MIIAVSPYHLTTREAPALVSLLLAKRVVTLLPSPAGGGAEARQAAGRIPTYLEFTKSWAWAVPLWKAGVIGADLDGDRPLHEIGAVTESIRRDDRYQAIRTFVQDRAYETERSYLAAVSRDLLRAGPDPGLSIPVVAGLDRFATRRAVYAARPPATSLAQAAEVRMGRPLFSVALPVFVQADARRLLHAREVLADALGDLWDAAAGLPEAVRDGGEVSRQALARFAEGAARFSAAFEDRRAEILEDCEQDDVRAVMSTASIHGVALPFDAALRSSVAAIRTSSQAAPAKPRTDLPAIYDEVEGRSFLSLQIKPLGNARRS